MSPRLLGHLRHNVVAYLALFFALSGSAFGAAAVIRSGDPAGGDLSGSYPNPSIAVGAVTGGAGGKVADNTLTGADILESSLGKVPSAGDADTVGGNAPSAFLPAGGKAADSDKLDGLDATAFFENTVIRSQTSTEGAQPGGQTSQVVARCNSDEQVVGGGGESLDDTDLVLAVSVPRPAEPPSGDDKNPTGRPPLWLVTFRNETSSQVFGKTVRAYAVCAS